MQGKYWVKDLNNSKFNSKYVKKEIGQSRGCLQHLPLSYIFFINSSATRRDVNKFYGKRHNYTRRQDPLCLLPKNL